MTHLIHIMPNILKNLAMRGKVWGKKAIDNKGKLVVTKTAFHKLQSVGIKDAFVIWYANIHRNMR